MPQLHSSRNSVVNSSPSENKAYNAWIVKDDFGNDVNEGDQVFVLENGATVHVNAAEDYIIEKLEAKYAEIKNWEGEPEGVFLFKDGAWMRITDIEDYFIEVLGAHVYERKSVLPKQNEQSHNR